RVAGGSTQLQGVASDIVLPSLTDLPEFGEGALKNCLPYDEVPKARYTKWAEPPQIYLEELKRRSEARVKEDPEFHYVMEDMERLRKKLDDNRISLNEDTRRTELNEDKMRKDARAKDRLARQTEDSKIYRLTLDTVDKPNLQMITFPGKMASAKKATVAPETAADSDSDIFGNDDGTKEPAIDPERDEALNILGDLVDLSAGPKTASASSPAATTPQ
ncbi:MAG: carboxy terminal-processing peptidase, partial [Chthoniobacterales bacterium]